MRKALAADTPPIIQRMLAAADTLSYRGHVVQIEGDQAQSLHILHRAGADGGESIAYAACKAPTGNCAARDKTAVSPCQRPTGTRRGTGGRSVCRACCRAGCKTWPSFTNSPRSATVDWPTTRPTSRWPGRAIEFRFAYLLGTDTATGLLLKASLIDSHGQVLRQVFFVDLELVPTLDDAEWLQEAGYQPRRNCSGRNTPSGNARRRMPSRGRSARCRPVSASAATSRRRSPGSDQEVEQLTISDGLATVSVFIDSPAPGEQSLLGAGRVQAIPAYGAQLAGRHVTVLGAAPMATLQQVVEALDAASRRRPTPTPATLPAASGEPP